MKSKKTRFIHSMREGFIVADAFLGRCTKDKVTVYAAQASFFVIISFVPFLMLLLALIRYVAPQSQYALLQLTQATLPGSLGQTANDLIYEVYNQSSPSLVSITAITTLWIASKSIHALTQALNDIYRTAETRNSFSVRLWSMVHTLLLAMIMLASMLLMLFGEPVLSLLDSWKPQIIPVFSWLLDARSLLFLAFISITFALMYKLLPNTTLKFRLQFPGAVFSALVWLVFSRLYEFYINHFANFSFTYGSLAAIVLMMLWLYVGLQIFLIGAEINLFLGAAN